MAPAASRRPLVRLLMLLALVACAARCLAAGSTDSAAAAAWRATVMREGAAFRARAEAQHQQQQQQQQAQPQQQQEQQQQEQQRQQEEGEAWTMGEQRSPLYSPLVAKQWEFSLPLSVLQQTFLFQGSTGLLKQVLVKLLTGRTVHVGLLGGSISAERGIPEGQGHGFFSLISKWLPDAFPKAKVITRNGAISGTPSTYSERILSTRLDPEVDLVLLEYAVNNRLNTSTLEYEDVRSFERVLRQLLEGEPQELPQPGGADAQLALGGAAQLARPRRGPAAVLILNMWRCCVHDGTGFVFTRFHDHLTDHHNILAQYYAVPSVAMRNGLHHALRSGEGIFSDPYAIFPVGNANSMVHPNALGHKYVADMLVYALYVALGQLQLHGLTRGDWDLARAPLPPPLVASAAVREVVLGSWHENALKAVVRVRSGWEWKHESGKGGFSTREPGSALDLRLDTSIPAHVVHAAAGQPVVVDVMLGLLKSYYGMGIVSVECRPGAGCECEPTEFDMNDPADLTSQTTMYALRIVKPYPLCLVRVTVLGRSTSEGGRTRATLRGVAVVATHGVEGGGAPRRLRDPPGGGAAHKE